MKRYDALALFSGGLDSILAMRLVMEQGLAVLGLHFVSPFFGKPRKVVEWREAYGLDIQTVDVGREYVDMMLSGPEHGFGKFLNPCIDCKILMLRRAGAMLAGHGASFVISGEVLGQRPMSQRLDALNIISRDSGARDMLLRPLCAKRFPPTAPERSGLVDRERLCAFSGRGRRDQLDLAARFGLTEIPTPAGGCLLTEMESVRRYAPVFRHLAAPGPEDFELANIGRQYWAGPRWLAIGRNMGDNDRIEAQVREGDLVFKTRDFPGPLALARRFAGSAWDEAAVWDAAAFAASYSPRARGAGGAVWVNVAGWGESPLLVAPERRTALSWREPTWDEAAADKAGLVGRTKSGPSDASRPKDR